MPKPLLERLTSLEEATKSVRADIARDTRLLEVLDEARLRVSLDTEYFSGLYEFGAEVTEYIRGLVRERLVAQLEQAKALAEGLLVEA